jgi:hypothetical protein
LCKPLALLVVAGTMAFVAATASLAAAHPLGASIVPVCALSPPSPFAVDLAVPADGARAGDREPAAWKNPPIEEAPTTGHGRGFSATIPVYFHVFREGRRVTSRSRS